MITEKKYRVDQCVLWLVLACALTALVQVPGVSPMVGALGALSVLAVAVEAFGWYVAHLRERLEAKEKENRS